MFGRRRGVQGCVAGPERCNRYAHEARSLEGSTLERAASSLAGAYPLTSVPARRGNGLAHHRALWRLCLCAGGAYDNEPAERRPGRVPGRTYAEPGGEPNGSLSARDGGQFRSGRRADRGAAVRGAHMMPAPVGEGIGRSHRSVHGPA